MPRRAKSPIPLSTFTGAEWALPGEDLAHRLKVDPAGFTCRVSLCGLTVTPGAGKPWVRLGQLWRRAARERRICAACEAAAHYDEQSGEGK